MNRTLALATLALVSITSIAGAQWLNLDANPGQVQMFVGQETDVRLAISWYGNALTHDARFMALEHPTIRIQKLSGGMNRESVFRVFADRPITCRLKAVYAAPNGGRLERTIPIRIVPRPQPRVHTIKLFLVLPCGTLQDVTGQPINLTPCSPIARIVAKGYCARGRELRFDATAYLTRRHGFELTSLGNNTFQVLARRS